MFPVEIGYAKTCPKETDAMRVQMQAFLDVNINWDVDPRTPFSVEQVHDAVRAAILQSIRAEDFSLTGWTQEP